MPTISSIHNGRIKQIRALRSRKERAQAGLFFVEGVRGVAEALQFDAAIETLVIAPALLTSALGWEIAARHQQRGGSWLEVTPEVFASLAAKDVTQGLGAVVRQRWLPLDRVQPDAGCWVALDSVQYPGNIGTILRTVDAVGGAGVILLGSTADPYDPLAVRASLGAIFSLQLVRASADQFAAWKRRVGVPVVGTSPAAPADYRAVQYPLPAVLLMGGERLGLSPAQQALCDMLVQIPMVGRSDSLNLAVATALVLYELFHQQRTVEAVHG